MLSCVVIPMQSERNGETMKSVGLVKSRKENEKRRAIMPSDISQLLHPEMFLFEKGYWEDFGVADSDVLKVRFAEREAVLQQDIICDPKIGDAEYLGDLKNQTIFGWIHAVQNRDITDKIVRGGLTAYAWEDLNKKGRHEFWRNNSIAGEAAIMHAFQCYGDMPYNTKVALLGRGNVAQGALKILTLLGADVTVYTRATEALFREEFTRYDVIVNAILWDVSRRDHILYKADLKRMKKPSLIIDISCDRAGGIETSVPTTIKDPIYFVDGVAHYAVDHTPSLFYRMVSSELSRVAVPYLNELVCDEPSSELLKCKIIDQGVILDQRINLFQNR